MIEVRDLVKRYGDHLAVDHVSFTIEEGKIYGFLGPNGAGKSTTMNIMTGYLSPTEGEVLINGHNILNEPEEAKRCIGYLPEIPPLYLDMTVKEYLFFAAELKGVPKAQRYSEVQRVVESTHLEEMYNRLTGNLSKGYRQRVGIAQAIIGSPNVIILDEPTIGLDPKQIIQIRDLIHDLAKKHTVILSSHILSEVQEVCNQVIIINNGVLLASGTPQELERKLGASTMELVLKTTNPTEVKNILSTIPGITKVTCTIVSGKKELNANVKFKPGSDLREAVFNACARAGCPLLMMKTAEFSLENIFLQLTQASDDSKSQKNKAENVPSKKGTEA